MYTQKNIRSSKQAKHGGSHLKSYLLGRKRLGGLWLEANPGQKFGETSSQSIAGHSGVDQSSKAMQEA
jgi:hypothetical protein